MDTDKDLILLLTKWNLQHLYELIKNSEAAAAWNNRKLQLENEGRVQLGRTSVDMPYYHCYDKECFLGNFFCDAMADAVWEWHSSKNDSLTQVPIALINYEILEGMQFSEGNITYSTIADHLNYKNTLTAFNLLGKYLLAALEQGASERLNIRYHKLLHMGVLKVTYDLQRPQLQRVIDIQVRCGNLSSSCYEPFSENSTYRIVAPNSLIDGTDNFQMIRNHASNKQSYMPLLDAVKMYIQKKSPINPRKEGRIVVV